MASENGHRHAHGAHAHTHDALSERGRRRLLLVLLLTAAYMLAEAAGGWWTGSLALLADAGHMLADVAGLPLALVAARVGGVGKAAGRGRGEVFVGSLSLYKKINTNMQMQNH